MNILMIGNGFDLEHDLPTDYMSFLAFIEDVRGIFLVKEKELRLKFAKNKYVSKLLENDKNNVLEFINEMIEDNIWIKFFKNKCNENRDNEKNWIDFESEICLVIKKIDDLLKYYKSSPTEIKDKKTYDFNNFIIKKIPVSTDVVSFKNENEIKINIDKLIDDLNRLVVVLEIYIQDYIDNKEILYYNPDISKIEYDKVISFNYSDTYRKLYAPDNYEVEYDFVHGKAQNNISIIDEGKKIEEVFQEIEEKNNMVLGIEEYLPKDRRNKEIDFIYFKKYYQRICKQTGSKYKKWLQEIDKGESKDNMLYIFGHSLSPTDGDILRDLINHKRIKTVVYYRNRAQLDQQISNLVQVLGSKTVIESVYGNNPNLEFRLQNEKKEIAESFFEINKDITRLRNLYRLDRDDATNLFTKINEKIKRKDLKYFYSQETSILLFGVLQKIGIGKKYEKNLLDIAEDLRDDTGLLSPINYNYEQIVEKYGLSHDIYKFINSINEFNQIDFNIDIGGILNFNDDFAKYQQIIKDNIEINDEEYTKIIQMLFFIFHTSNTFNDKNLLDILEKISNGPAKKVSKRVLLKLIEESADNYDIVRYNYILSMINE